MQEGEEREGEEGFVAIDVAMEVDDDKEDEEDESAQLEQARRFSARRG